MRSWYYGNIDFMVLNINNRTMANHWISTVKDRWNGIPPFYTKLIVINAVLIFCMFTYLHIQAYKLHRVEQNFRLRDYEFSSKLLKIVGRKGVGIQNMDVGKKSIQYERDRMGPEDRVDLLNMNQTALKIQSQ